MEIQIPTDFRSKYVISKNIAYKMILLMIKFINLLSYLNHICDDCKKLTLTLHESSNTYEYRKIILNKLKNNLNELFDSYEITTKEFKEDMYYFDIIFNLTS